MQLDHPSDASRHSRIFEFALLALLAVVAVVVPTVIARHYGALASPRSDDWSYLRTLFEWDRTGRWDFNNWTSMTLVGQILISAPIVKVFGHSIVALRIFVACIGFAGLAGIVMMSPAVGVTRRRGAFVALVIAVGPLWAPLAATFLTDVPAFAFQTLSIAVASIGLRRSQPSNGLLALSLGLGVVAASIRQYAVVTLVAILLTHLLAARSSGDRQRVRTVVIASAITGAVLIALFAWWSTIPNSLTFAPRVHLRTIEAIWENAGGFLRLSGLLLLPVVALARPVEIVRRALRADRALAIWTTALTFIFLAISYESHPIVPFIGNYVDRRGVLGDDILHGFRPKIMPVTWFNLLAALASVSAMIIVLAAVPALAGRLPELKRKRVSFGDPVVTLLVLAIVGYGSAYLAASVVDLPVFDRYWLPVLPLIGLLILRSSRREATQSQPWAQSARPHGAEVLHVVATTIAVLLIVALGVVFSTESASYDGARWRIAELVTERGYSASDIDAGYEWVGFHLHRAPPYRLFDETKATRKRIARAYLEGLCVTVVVNPLKPGKIREHAIATTTAVGMLRKPVHLYAVRNKKPCAVAYRP